MKTVSVAIYNKEGKKEGEQKLNPQVFGVTFVDALVHQVVTAQQANARHAIAHTKDRGEVRGGGRKPWKQKGTGRARHGSRRSPIWVGGGITFGPRSDRNFSHRINDKMRKKALLMVLSDKVRNDRLVVVDGYNVINSKTKSLAQHLDKLPSKRRDVVLVTSKNDTDVMRACKNLPAVNTLGVTSLNTLDVLKARYIIIPKNLVEMIEKRYTEKKTI